MIPKPTERDRCRDMLADYEFVRRYERKGDTHAMACTYIRLFAEKQRSEDAASREAAGKTKNDPEKDCSTG